MGTDRPYFVLRGLLSESVNTPPKILPHSPMVSAVACIAPTVSTGVPNASLRYVGRSVTTNTQPTLTPNCTAPKSHMFRVRASRPIRRYSDSSGAGPGAGAAGAAPGGWSRTSSQNSPATASPHSPYTTNTPRQLVSFSPGSGGTEWGAMTHSTSA